jgi:hypothetical protein
VEFDSLICLHSSVIAVAVYYNAGTTPGPNRQINYQPVGQGFIIGMTVTFRTIGGTDRRLKQTTSEDTVCLDRQSVSLRLICFLVPETRREKRV